MYSCIRFIKMLTSSRHEMKWSIILIDNINVSNRLFCLLNNPMLGKYLFLIFFAVDYIHLRWYMTSYLYYCTYHPSAKLAVCTGLLGAGKVLLHGSIPST